MNCERKRHRLLDDLFGSETEDKEDEIDLLDDFDLNSEEEEIPKPKIRRRPNKDRQHAEGNKKLMKDYLLDDSTYYDLCPYFVQKPDCTGKFGLSSYQKITSALQQLAYGCAMDATDKYPENTFEGPIVKT
ncbi:hypothetical protein PTTG_28215 [Puccinia triticina 1-1 BBBD Race 1]|uniref:Uncharacterized protein n=1 Tax=Puccinia triticina (isolate 1-1 / race 1 (BBBD)) TaxID=630390 RepID=A0A180GFH7_PUCT1|nr:hypothetical protein PTTG_28215 [Puccinia triticina 1-1 BBBD Race 1]